MAGINQIQCIGNARNTGVPLCPIDPQQIKGSILVPRGSQFDVTANSGVLLTTLSALFYNVSKAARFYPLYDYRKLDDKSDSLILTNFPDGSELPTREGFNKHTFQYADGRMSKHQAARSFNGSNWDWYYYDTNPFNGQCTLYGIQGSTANMFRAFPVLPGGFFWAHPIKPNSGTEVTQYMVQHNFMQKYYNDLLCALPLPFDLPTQLPGLNDMVIGASATVNGTAKNFNLTVLSSTGTDLAALYTTVLTTVANWTCKVASSGVSLTISSITYTPSVDGGVTPGYLTFVIGATGYPTPPAPILFNTVAPATLVAAGMQYESTGAFSIAST